MSNSIICPICENNYTNLRFYKSHLNSHKKNEDRELVIEERKKIALKKYKLHQCKSCKKSFTRIDSLKYHQKSSCKLVAPDTNESIEPPAESEEFIQIKDMIQSMEDKSELEKLYQLLSLRLNKNEPPSSIPNNNNNNNNQTTNNTKNMNMNMKTSNNNNTNNNGTIVNDANEVTIQNKYYNIVINNFGEANENIRPLEDNMGMLNPYIERVSFLIDDEEKRNKNPTLKYRIYDDEDGIRKGLEDTLEELYRMIHCNKDYPENHNIYISNMKKSVMFFIHIDDNWERCGDIDHLRDEVDNMYQILIKSLDNYLDTDCDENEAVQLRKIKKTIQEKFTSYRESLKKSLSKKYFDITYKNKGIIGHTFDKTSQKRKLQLNYNTKS